MRVDPKINNGNKGTSKQTNIETLMRRLALILVFGIMYFFFIKLLFL
jgi:hypothetical protein